MINKHKKFRTTFQKWCVFGIDGDGFTRLWIGILPASTIELTEDLHIDESLITILEKVFYKPYAKSDWDY